MTARVDSINMRRLYYRVPFQTEANQETEVIIPLSDFDAYAFGSRVPQAPRFGRVRNSVFGTAKR